MSDTRPVLALIVLSTVNGGGKPPTSRAPQVPFAPTQFSVGRVLSAHAASEQGVSC